MDGCCAAGHDRRDFLSRDDLVGSRPCLAFKITRCCGPGVPHAEVVGVGDLATSASLLFGVKLGSTSFVSIEPSLVALLAEKTDLLLPIVPLASGREEAVGKS